jgi:hypothetical protein
MECLQTACARDAQSCLEMAKLSESIFAWRTKMGTQCSGAAGARL